FSEALVVRGWSPGVTPTEGPSKAPIDVANGLEADCVSTIVEGWITPESLARAETGAADWCAAEILPNAGEGLRARDTHEARAAAEARFTEAWNLARAQGALAWQLRTATSWARLRLDQGRKEEARALVGETIACFREGLDTADMVAARELLNRSEATQ